VKEKAAAPAADPAGGEILSGTAVTLKTATEGARIHYTLDSTTPTSASALYANPVTISGADGGVVMLKAIAVKEGYTDSGVLEAAYTVKVPGKAITAFSFASPAAVGTLNGTEIAVAVPPFISLTGLVPAITVSPGASVSPPSGEARDFRDPVRYTVTAEDGSVAEYTVTVTAVCIDMAGVAAYLAAPTRGEAGTVADPIPLPVRIFLNDTAGNGWRDLLRTIKDGGKYVELDLSACTMTGTEFDPQENCTGESYVTALVLPDAAESTKAVVVTPEFIPGSLFGNFSALKSIRGDNIVTIGALAFGDTGSILSLENTALVSAEFPHAERIGSYAFAYCAALTTLNLESVTVLEYMAFKSCTALRKLSLPRVESIGDAAFRNCTALGTLYVPRAVSLGESLFEGTGGPTAHSSTTALTLILGSPAPSLGGDAGRGMFGAPEVFGSETVYGKSVTIRIPAGAEGYDEAWKAKFKIGLYASTPAYEEYTPEPGT
jgi:hypothetical protein